MPPYELRSWASGGRGAVLTSRTLGSIKPPYWAESRVQTRGEGRKQGTGKCSGHGFSLIDFLQLVLPQGPPLKGRQAARVPQVRAEGLLG